MPERYAAEKSRRKRHMVKFELDGITAKKRKPRLVEVYSHLYFLQRDNAKRKPYTGNRLVRFDEKGEVERPLLYSTIRVHLRFFESLIFQTGFTGSTGYVINPVHPVILSNSKSQLTAPWQMAKLKEGG
ncbi:hypothetical protein ig2599ANME_0677 [groundwater metagenome]